MNSFALIIGHCVVIPPSAKAALLIVLLTFVIGVQGEADVKKAEFLIAQQYISSGKNEDEAIKKINWLNECFISYKAVK